MENITSNFRCFKMSLCPFALHPEPLTSVIQLATIPANYSYSKTSIKNLKFRHLVGLRIKLFFRGLSGPLRFTSLFPSVNTSCGLYFAFRHLSSFSTSSRAIYLISAYVLDTVCSLNSCKSSLIHGKEERIFVFSAWQVHKCSLQWLGPGPM